MPGIAAERPPQVYLAGDSVRAEQPDLARAFRARALVAGSASGAVAIGGLLVLRSDARAIYDGLTSGGGLAMVIVSALAGGATLWLVWQRRGQKPSAPTA